MLYQYLITAETKIYIDATQKKEYKHNTKGSHQTTREQKRKGERKRCIKQLTKWQKEHMHACLLSRVSLPPYGLQPTRLLWLWDSPGKKYWRGFPFPPPGDLHNPRIKPSSPVLAGRFLTTEPLRKPKQKIHINNYVKCKQIKCPNQKTQNG